MDIKLVRELVPVLPNVLIDAIEGHTAHIRYRSSRGKGELSSMA
jgi:hypothetical protein